MLAGGVTESIRYFAGYLDTFEDAKVARLHHGGEPQTLLVSDWQPGASVAMTAPATLAETATGSSKARPQPGANEAAPVESSYMPIPRDAEGFVVIGQSQAAYAPALEFPGPFAMPVQQMSVVFSTRELPYEISFAEGGNALLLEISQTNLMLDLDQMLSIAGTKLQNEGQAELLDAMLGAAGESVIAHVAFPSGGGWAGILLEDVPARADGDIASGLAAGRYVNGLAVEEERIDALTRLPDRPDAFGQRGDGQGRDLMLDETSLVAGGNVSINQALIVDLNEASRTLAVEGDVFISNKIFQSIVYRDSDMIWTQPDTKLEPQDSTFENDAIFRNEDPHLGQAAGITSNGIEVRVDVFDGDLIDAKSIIQRNLVADGDIVSQSVTETIALVETGENWQVNSVQLIDWTQYDLIIVRDDYYAVNVIVQISTLMDDDLVMAKAGGDAGDGSSIATGDNAVSNQATIESIGADWTETPQAFAALAAQLAAGEDPGLGAWASISGSATGALDVLIVKGDYYDINAIHQLNVVIDNDWVVQTGGHHGRISSGANHIVNDARIVDLGGMSKQYVGGQVYEDAMLMQASLAYGDDAEATIVNGDTHTLASEFVAFAGLDAFGDAGGREDEPTFAGASHGIFDDLGAILV